MRELELLDMKIIRTPAAGREIISKSAIWL
jgi:hypothetical protein